MPTQPNRTKALRGTLLAILLSLASCFQVHRVTAPDPWAKVELELTNIDKDGLRGPPDGKVAISYEFSIPNTVRCKAEVKEIDSSVQLMPGSAGRIGSGRDECLCIGTAGKNYRSVLERLAALPYIERIRECHFE